MTRGTSHGCSTIGRGGVPGGGGLHAHAFPLHDTLLAASLASAVRRSEAALTPERPGPANDSVASRAPRAAQGRTAAATAASSLALPGVVEDVGEYLQSAKNPCGDVCCLIELARQQQKQKQQQQQYGGGGGAPVAAGLKSLVLLPLVPLEEGAMLGLYLCFPQQLPRSLLAAVQESCTELLQTALQALLLRKLHGPLAAEYGTLQSAVPGSYAVLHDAAGELGLAVLQELRQSTEPALPHSLETRESMVVLNREMSVDEIDLFFMMPAQVVARPVPLLRPQASRLGGGQLDRSAVAVSASRASRYAATAGDCSTSGVQSSIVRSKSSGDALALQTCPADVRVRHAELLTSASSFIVVTGPDDAGIVRTRMDLMMGSVGASLGAAAVGGVGGRCAYPEDLEMLELGDELGRGGAGVVYTGRLATTEVAVKLMEVLGVNALEGRGAAGSSRQAAEQQQLRQRRELLRNAMEMVVQSNVSHPQIVQLYSVYRGVRKVQANGRWQLRCSSAASADVGSGATATGGDQGAAPHLTAIVCELCEMGSLGDMLGRHLFPHRIRSADGRRDEYDTKGVLMTLLDVAMALRHLHSMHLVHRDVKPANLLLKSSPRDRRGFTVKLGDFGFVLRLTEVAEDGSRYAVPDQACGTVTHMAPEGLPDRRRPEGARIDTAVDIYAVGILMWELLAGGVRPFRYIHADDIPRHVCNGARPMLGPEVPPWYRCLAQACWAADPRQRPTAHQLVVALSSKLRGGAEAGEGGGAQGGR